MDVHLFDNCLYKKQMITLSNNDLIKFCDDLISRIKRSNNSLKKNAINTIVQIVNSFLSNDGKNIDTINDHNAIILLTNIKNIDINILIEQLVDIGDTCPQGRCTRLYQLII